MITLIVRKLKKPKYIFKDKKSFETTTIIIPLQNNIILKEILELSKKKNLK